MSCQVYRDLKGEITSVTAPNGKESKLYESLSKLIGDKEEALRAWAKVYTPSFKQWFGDWEAFENTKKYSDQIKGMYATLFKTDAEQVLFEAAIQAQTARTDKLSESAAAFGYDIMAAATQMFPNAKLGDVYKPTISKIVDDNGEPLLVYHVSEAENIKKFNKAKIAKYNKDGRRGFFFSPNLEEIELYGGTTYPVFLSIKEPYIANAREEGDKVDFKKHDGFMFTSKIEDKDLGFPAGFTEVIAYEPEQIKSVYNQGTFDPNKGDIYQQLRDNPNSIASTTTLAKIKEFLDRIGVKVSEMQNIVVNGTNIGANGVAKIMSGLIEIVQGKEDIALPEEAMHFAVELLRQKNPTLYMQMYNKVGQYKLYQQVLNDYKDIYKTEEGLPDIPKIKKEALARILVETIINKNEGSNESAERLLQTKSWWDKFVDWFKGLFSKAGFNPFEQVAEDINKGAEDLGQASDLKTGSDYYQKRDDLLSKLKEENTKIGKDTSGSYTRAGTSIKKTVSSIVGDFYETKRRNKNLTEDESQKALREYKEATAGKGATDIEDILHRSIGDDNKLRVEILPQTQPSALSPKNKAYYNTLQRNIDQRLNSYPAGTDFLHNIEIYDDKRGIVGKADLIAITPTGKVNIIQFKFPNIGNKDGVLKSYEQTAYNIELEELRKILTNSYGVDKKDFDQTRAIPIRSYYTWIDWNNKSKGTRLANLKIGNVDVSLEKDDSLLPVASQSESTGNKELDTLLYKLRGLLDKLQNEKVSPSEADQKGARINTLIAAIRKLQVQRDSTKVLENANILIKRAESLYTDLQKQVDEADPNLMSIPQVNKLSADLLDAKDNLLLYKDLDIVMERIYSNPDEKGKKFIEDAGNIARRSSRLIRNLEDLEDKTRTEIFAAKMGIKDELNPEKALTWYRRMIRSLSQSSIKAGEELWSLVKRINNGYQIRFDERLKLLNERSEAVKKWADTNGGMKEVYNKVFAFDSKGRWQGRFISQTDRQFYKNLEEKKKAGDLAWVKDNIDLDKYKEWYDEEYAKRLTNSKILRLDPDDTKNEALVKKNLDEFVKNYDISNKTAVNSYNYMLNAFPKVDKWVSKEFGELNKKGNEPLLELYNYWQDVLKQSHDAGLIASFERRTFFPNVRKEYLEKTLYNPGAIAGSFIDGIRIENEDTSFGKQDPLTGEPIDNVHAAYVYDLGKQAKDTDGNYFIDYSEKSMDLFKVMAIWERELIRYNLKIESESIAKLIASTESRKKALAVNRMGNLIKDKGVPLQIDNTTNTKYVKDFIDAIYYGKKLDNETDFTFSVPYGSAVKKINALFGREVFPVPTEESVKVSGSKALQTFNRYFVAKTLGANPLTALSQLWGGTANSYINSGKFFTKTDLLAAQAKMISGRFYDAEGKIQAGLLDYFIPLMEDQTNEKLRELSVNKAVKYLSSDWLMYMQRVADKGVQIPVFLAFAENTTIRDGKLVNIRELIKKENGYDVIYDLPYEQQQGKKQEIEQKINELKNKESLLKLARIEGDKLILPGIDRGSDTVTDFRQRVIEFTKDALGNTSNEDLSLYKRSVMMQSFFMFKNWIPRMIDVRGQSLKYNPGTDSYEWGRIRMLFRGLQTNGLSTIGSLIKQLSGNEKDIIEIAKKLYTEKQSVFAAQNEEFNMSEADFIDMYLKGVRAEFKEIGLTLSLLGILVFARVHAPDKDDDPQIKGMYKWSLRAIDKLTDELSFFYDPTSFTNIANGSVFPAVSLLTDAQKLLMNGIKDAYYWSTGNEQGMKSIHSAKYVMKSLPFVSQLVNYTAVFNNDFAKEWGIQLSSQNGRR